jgi:hypothetical protein
LLLFPSLVDNQILLLQELVDYLLKQSTSDNFSISFSWENQYFTEISTFIRTNLEGILGDMFLTCMDMLKIEYSL